MRFAGVDVLVQVSPLRVAGTQPTSTASRVVDAWHKVEEALLGVASSVATTIDRMPSGTRRPRELEVQFGFTLSTECEVVVVKGSAEATISVKMTYDLLE